VLVLLGVMATLKLCPVFINANEIEQMAGFRESNESRGEGNGSNEPVIICRNKGERVLHKKEISCKVNTNTNGKNAKFFQSCVRKKGD